MVERPIKKSDRQTVAEPSDVVEERLEKTEPSPIEVSQDSVSQPPEERSTPKPFRGKDKSKGKDKGNQQEEDRSRQGNPALMRGPKPTKPKPPAIKQTQEATESDSVTEPEQETTSES